MFQHFSFQSPVQENIEKFKSDIADKETKGIYQYSIAPIGHESKPKIGDVLEVEPSVTP